jgi:CRISPR-associated exonuclease Cas4
LYDEDDLLPISALQHVVFCERQAALIHLERMWSENAHTIEGTHMHGTAHEAGSLSRRDLRISRSLPLRSLRLGLAGVADVVEFRCAADGCELSGIRGRWTPYPVEYKKGRRKKHNADAVQLCAQALCLEEMFAVRVVEGALFYGAARRRVAVAFDDDLRRATEKAAERFRAIFQSLVTPPPVWGPKCSQCSLIEDCRPRSVERSVHGYLAAVMAAASEDVP